MLRSSICLTVLGFFLLVAAGCGDREGKKVQSTTVPATDFPVKPSTLGEVGKKTGDEKK